MSKSLKIIFVLAVLGVAFYKYCHFTHIHNGINSSDILLISEGNYDEKLSLKFEIKGRNLVYCEIEESSPNKINLNFYDRFKKDIKLKKLVRNENGFELEVIKKTDQKSCEVWLFNKEKLTEWFW